MFEDLRQKGNKTAVKRSIYGLIGIIGLIIIFFFDVFNAGIDANMKRAALALGVVAAVACIVNWIRAANASLINGIEKFCKKTANPDAMMARLEKTWSDGFDFKSGKMDREYIIMILGLHTNVVPLEKAVWVYKRTVNNRGVMRVCVVVAYNNGKERECALNHAAVDMILQYLLENSSDIAVGYTKETAKSYRRKDMMAVREQALTQRIGSDMKS
jgi:hypothetical protein